MSEALHQRAEFGSAGAVCEFLLCPQDLLSNTSDKINLLAKLEQVYNRILSLENQVGEAKELLGEAKELVRLGKLTTWPMTRVGDQCVSQAQSMTRVKDQCGLRVRVQYAIGTQRRSICVLVRMTWPSLPSPATQGLLGKQKAQIAQGFAFCPENRLKLWLSQISGMGPAT